MAAAFTPVGDHAKDKIAVGDRYVLIGTIALSGNYAVGGDALSFVARFAQTGLGEVDFVEVHPIAGYLFEYDYDDAKLQVFQQTDPAAAGGANIPLVELAAAAYPAALTGATPRVLVWGR